MVMVHRFLCVTSLLACSLVSDSYRAQNRYKIIWREIRCCHVASLFWRRDHVEVRSSRTPGLYGIHLSSDPSTFVSIDDR